jgi:hypothetical protein
VGRSVGSSGRRTVETLSSGEQRTPAIFINNTEVGRNEI